ncbi:hypothetical protein Rsub_09965 [Raphidocelis subcapitata]|uniref:Methyltransferase type 11 domain-containing protein n=1 Tax=Raphidocelis subcapitata TaxID=307507 RepID=A0A2V0PBN8_9CHLO|nr:hypothetical protein Rsub_09965 [Raphidocelis subcapitata]|eukprot:GBF97274.1 hypothetical protein Rsub_09965 [Raphidocelis subcapitata]
MASAPAPAPGARYGDVDFWRASAPRVLEQPVEWYADANGLKPLLARHLAYGDNILVVGPGASALHERLYDGGYRGLTVVDAADEVLDLWRARAEGRAVKFEKADVVQGLGYEHYSYNAIVDKASRGGRGTIDCLLCRDVPHGEADARAALRHLHAALRAPGTLLLVSHSPPEVRLPLLRCCEWESIEAKVLTPPPLADVAAGRSAAPVIQDAVGRGAALDAAAAYLYVCRKPY